MPDFSTLWRRQRTLNVSLPYRSGTGPLRWIWQKINIGANEATLEVRVVEVTTSITGDAPMLSELLDLIPPDQDIGSVRADGAYDTRKCQEAMATRDAHDVMPPRKNAKPWKPTGTGAVDRNEAMRASHYHGKAL